MSAAATPSAFSEWVFHHTRGQRPPALEGQLLAEQERGERCRLGAMDHQEINRICKRLGHEQMVGNGKYEVEYADNDQNTENVFEMPSLQVGKHTVRGRPDLVLKNIRTGHVIIVERKTTSQQRLIDQSEERNWKNIQAQLWCYSYISMWSNAPRMTLVGQLWRNHGTTLVPTIKPFIWETTYTRTAAATCS
jgi:hypothetical protein